MRRFAAIISFVLSLLVSVAMAQNAPPMPKPGPEHQKIDFFAGTWGMDGVMKPSPYGPGGKVTVTEHNEWLPGGFFLVTHSDAQMAAMGNAKGLAIIGYDADAKTYTYDEYNSLAEATHSKGTVEGDTWTWLGEEKMGGQVIKGRFTVKQLSPTAYNFKYEMQPPGAEWATMMEGKATKK